MQHLHTCIEQLEPLAHRICDDLWEVLDVADDQVVGEGEVLHVRSAHHRLAREADNLHVQHRPGIRLHSLHSPLAICLESAKLLRC